MTARIARTASGVAAVVLWVAVAGGCGYTTAGTLPGHLRSVAVPMFRNFTTQPAVETLLTRAVVEAFSTNGRLRVAPASEADAVLEGAVTGYQVYSIAFDRAANVRQYRLVVTLNLTFRDVREQRILFQQADVQERADFRVAGAVSDTISLEEAALRTAAVDIARAVVTRAIDRF